MKNSPSRHGGFHTIWFATFAAFHSASWDTQHIQPSLNGCNFRFKLKVIFFSYFLFVLFLILFFWSNFWGMRQATTSASALTRDKISEEREVLERSGFDPYFSVPTIEMPSFGWMLWSKQMQWIFLTVFSANSSCSSPEDMLLWSWNSWVDKLGGFSVSQISLYCKHFVCSAPLQVQWESVFFWLFHHYQFSLNLNKPLNHFSNEQAIIWTSSNVHHQRSERTSQSTSNLLH